MKEYNKIEIKKDTLIAVVDSIPFLQVGIGLSGDDCDVVVRDNTNEKTIYYYSVKKESAMEVAEHLDRFIQLLGSAHIHLITGTLMYKDHIRKEIKGKLWEK